MGKDQTFDLAVLKISTRDLKLTVATFADSSQLQVGQKVLATGNPLGMQRVTSGIVSALGQKVATIPDTIETDAAINPGNSGGALLYLQRTRPSA
jgi:S1-C subfamily serine protease